ncbi:MAG: hypothetical protein QGI68_14650 [Pseudomonadales bacterium]|jgi:hypothetical protein|nr:hypothetical protein [Pseudomonadales bacterium]MDP7596786.1 hypothetical protein [Pseudomonadales bacterium]HJN51594.1 hypothetical protein [Pseudomonadales bacterium]|tara:strand:+ start:2578 stop:3819 length:1242 start_codon:yes stop_codon:yes gene_type:complete
MSRAFRLPLCLACLLASTNLSAFESSIRLKMFGTAAFLPGHDIQRQLDSTPAWDLNGDMRMMFRHDWGVVRILVDHSTTVLSGDTFAFANAPQTTLDQPLVDDDARIMDLTFDIEDGGRHRSLHRLDRLALQYRSGKWAVNLGRQAVSWGNGMVFSPMDLFNPFAPTVVDQDHKAGDDLVLVERLFSNGNDMQFLAVGRRDPLGDITANSGSVAIKFHALMGDAEMELLAAKHFTDRVLAISVRMPLGGAMLRSDVVATRLRDGDVKVSTVTNLDYSISVGEVLVYMFAEYFRNGFGVSKMPTSIAMLPMPLQSRLARGEVFNVMRDYTAVGVAIPWHPLVNQSLAFLSNLHDSSSFLQTSVTYDPGDRQRLQLGLVKPLGRAGDEFGGVPLNGAAFTTGAGARLFFRWQYYF